MENAPTFSRLVEIDESVRFRDQIQDESTGQVVLVNVFHIPADDTDGFLQRWTQVAHALESKPGHVSTQLHRGIAGSNTFLNYAVWDTVEAYRAAIEDPEIDVELRAVPGAGTTSPHLYRKQALAS